MSQKQYTRRNRMNIVLAVNAGSSSLKFQMYEMPNERVIVSGVIERIGLKDSIFTMKFNGDSVRIMVAFFINFFLSLF